MAEATIKSIDDLRGTYGGLFKLARAELGITSFGLQVIDLPPNADLYPEHDHGEDGMEEVYLVVSGGGTLKTPAGSQEVGAETLVAVPSGVSRHWTSGADGLRLLCIGGVPGKAYEVQERTELSALES
jgi:mannose-6-phosphate isomerase-like protein (cupin superfamily)